MATGLSEGYRDLLSTTYYEFCGRNTLIFSHNSRMPAVPDYILLFRLNIPLNGEILDFDCISLLNIYTTDEGCNKVWRFLKREHQDPVLNCFFLDFLSHCWLKGAAGGIFNISPPKVWIYRIISKKYFSFLYGESGNEQTSMPELPDICNIPILLPAENTYRVIIWQFYKVDDTVYDLNDYWDWASPLFWILSEIFGGHDSDQ